MIDAKFESANKQGKAVAPEAVTALLESAVLNPSEYRERYGSWDDAAFTRVLLAQSKDYNLVLTCWDRAQFSPVHDHDGSASWVKVLEGDLHEALYNLSESQDSDGEQRLELSRSGSLPPDSVTFNGPSAIHGCSNVGSKR